MGRLWAVCGHEYTNLLRLAVSSCILRAVHPQSNLVEIPTWRIEEVFLEAAQDRFTGKIEVYVSVDEAAAEHVHFRFERTSTRRLDQVEAPTAQEVGFATRQDQLEFDPRRQSVRQGIAAAIAPLFRLGTPIIKLTGHFHGGTLRAIDIQDVP